MNFGIFKDTDNQNDLEIIKLLLYYDIFHHPLSLDEIIYFCHLTSEKDKALSIIEKLISEHIIYHVDGLYSIRNDLQLFERRKKGSLQAKRLVNKAHRMANLIHAFPFVRSVSLSGSFSKDYMDPDKDIDFFIITTPGKLWLARTLLILFKKTLLLNSYKYFCINYLVDEEHLEILDKNIFTATEIFTLIPVTGMQYIDGFYRSNTWVSSYYKGFPWKGMEKESYPQRKWHKKFVEFLLHNRFGEFIDKQCMRLTIHYWKKKYNFRLEQQMPPMFRFHPHVAKYHPGNFQEKVLSAYADKIKSFEDEKKITLS